MNLDKLLNISRKVIPKPVFKFFQPTYHLFLAVSGNIRYGFPGRKMIIIGVTGTNGKSTTVEIINSILKEAGFKTGMLSTVAFEIAGKRQENTTNRTTLGRWQTPKLLSKMYKKGCTHVVIEVASEGLIMHRVWGVPFDVAVFTNLTPEHLNTHKTMENYRDAKGKLFAGLMKSKHKAAAKSSVINADDKYHSYFHRFNAERKYLYGIKGGNIRATDIVYGDKTKFIINDVDLRLQVESSLPASFNVYNMLAAYSVGRALDILPETIIAGINKVNMVRGRMEEVDNKFGLKIYVDYAVTPDSFELLFGELKRDCHGKLIAVFGATGDRDKEKRPELGKIAAKLTDYIVLTDEEPYSENPAVIVDSIAEGIQTVRRGNYEILLDRREAIKRALEIAEKGDTVVITGMGHQKYRNIGGTNKIEWDEVKVIKDILGDIS